MTKSAVSVACVGLLCLGVATRSAAEPITITGGTMLFSGAGGPSQAGPISLVGTRGFSLDGFVDTGEGRVDPLASCFPCEPSATISVGTLLTGLAVGGRATLDGKTYTDIGGFLDTSATVSLRLAGTIRLPEIGPSPVVITGPFTVGMFSFFRPPNPPPAVPEEMPLRGGGVVTLTLTPETPSATWALTTLRYDFVQAPTPEPGTLILVAGGIVGTALRARHRRERTGALAPR